MPIKNKDIGMDLVNNSPLVEQVANSQQSAVEDMMSEIIAEQTKAKATSIMNMVGVLTTVDFYQMDTDSSNNYQVDANGPSDIAYDNKTFTEIKNFKVKLTNSTNLQNDGDEDEKNYITNGSLIVLPRTIKPNINDFFIMEYYGKKMCYRISSVDVRSYENDSGFYCEYVLYKKDYIVPQSQISTRKLYIHELIGTTYRPIMTSNELEILNKFQKLYKHLSDTFNNLFYDKTIDAYICKNYDKERDNKLFNDINNINILGKRGGLFKGNLQGDSFTYQNVPHGVRIEDKVYDNLLNIFMNRNKVFRDYEGMLLSVEPLLGDDRVGYRRSVFGCVETQSIANYKHNCVSPIAIEILSPEVNSYLVGKMNAIHDSVPHTNPDQKEFFPESLKNLLINGKKQDMNLKCSDIIYNSLDSMMIETIVRYVYNRKDDFVDRFVYLYENMDNLYEHDISYANIYYLFPLIGFILEKQLEEMYKNNIILNY